MKGLELCEKYYMEFGRPMLEESFPDLLDKIAIGLIGSGSECYGYDDEISTDHDFEPGFCLFLPNEDIVDRKSAFALERAYAKLPKEFEGFSRGSISPVGGNRHGVIRTSEFFADKIGSSDGILTVEQWLKTPEYALSEATNGKIFFDGYGEVTKIRDLVSSMPDDIFKKKLAGNLLIMAQSGQYNYNRCLRHGEPAAAQLAVNEFVKSTMNCIFLLNGVYVPYYKWSFRAMRNLPELSIIAEMLEYLLTTNNDDDIAEDKYFAIEDVASDIIGALIDRDLTKATCGDLEKHAYSVNDGICDSEIRNLNILYAI